MTRTTGTTAEVSRPERRRDRTAWAVVVVVLVGWSALRAGLDFGSLVNDRGWSQVSNFFTAMLHPELSGEFVELAIRAAGVTLAYALLGTFLSVVIGVFGGIVLSERFWAPLGGPEGASPWAWRVWRFLFSVPRSVHEVIFGLILVNILGLDPLVAVLAIGIPFGAVTAKVFSELLDEAPTEAERALRAAGAGRLVSLVFGAVPYAAGDLLSYSFYRLECAIRSAAVLGIVGAGGLGFELALSFQSLEYEQMWTMLWALILISGIADAWSSLVRRRRDMPAIEMHATGRPIRPRRDPVLDASAVVITAMVPVAWWWIGADITTLWADRAQRLAGELFSDAWPPQIGDGGWHGLLDDTADTVALAVLALAISWTLACIVAFGAQRQLGRSTGARWLVWGLFGFCCRAVLLVARAVPPPVWAFLAVFVLFPGLWPGAAALALYNLGVLGRLQAEVVENLDDEPGRALRASGASTTGVLAFATVPAVSGRFVALGLYRWEVAIRETVIVGVVGAAGLGRRINEQTASFDYDGILASIFALIVVTVAVDFASASIRRTLR